MNNVAVLVVSCDAYADAWQPFFQNFTQYWPDCPYPVYLQTNFLRPNFPDISILPVGKDHDWSSNLKLAIKKIAAEKILILLEDFWLWQPVKTDMITQLVTYFDTMQAGYLRLVPKPPPDVIFSELNCVGEINKGSNYRVSFQAGLWRSDILSQILVAGESAWEAEVAGSKRSNALSCNFLSVVSMPREKWPIRYLNAIIKRKWTLEAVQVAKQHNILLDFECREVCNAYDQLRRNKIFSQLVNVIATFSQKLLGQKIYNKFKRLPWVRKLIY